MGATRLGSLNTHINSKIAHNPSKASLLRVGVISDAHGMEVLSSYGLIGLKSPVTNIPGFSCHLPRKTLIVLHVIIESKPKQSDFSATSMKKKMPVRQSSRIDFGNSITIEWLIKRLIKVGAKVAYHGRKWQVHLASAFPLARHHRAVLG